MPGLKAYYQTRIRDARNLSTGLLMTESSSFFLQQRVRPELEKLGPPSGINDVAVDAIKKCVLCCGQG